MTLHPLQRSFTALLLIAIIFCDLPAMAPASVQAQSTQDSGTAIYLPLIARGAPVQATPADPIPSSALVTQALADNGKWPVQLAASTGAIQPTQHGPQRTDPAEGIPAHAYSPFDERNNREHPCPPGGCAVVAGQVLVKLAPAAAAARRGAQSRAVDAAFAAFGIATLEPIFPNAAAPVAGATLETVDGTLMPAPELSAWYRATLVDQHADIAGAVDKLRAADSVAWAEPAYVRKPAGNFSTIAPATVAATAAPAAVTIAQTIAFTDPLYAQQWHLAATNVPQAWQWLADHGLPPGGNRDIVVAVIDTGVDLNHPDLAANLWVNAAELAGQPGVDDDNNGYVDDLHGADMITNSGNPMDDHGHGTHVAGIIAAQAGNNSGGVGVAYNSQIMVLKAAQYSGVLSSSDIAEAIYYAVEKGADVINMSFGGYAHSQVEEDALAVAFGQAVLVAAAGNDNRVNQPCPGGRDMYPAAYNWVLGVMASSADGRRAGFSNSDCTPRDTHEYELMAPGVDVWSTLPESQYGAWDGTSMAAPVVSGIAALARTKWSDKDLYSSRFIMGQIAANTSGGIANANAALTQAPRPHLSYLQHWLFDTLSLNPINDNDGIVDAGETIDLAIMIRNHWGKADPVTVKLEAWAEGAFQPDPYVTMITDTVDYGAVGSFNWDDNGLIYDGQGVITGVLHPFRFTTSASTPNDHIIPFRLTISAHNGLNNTDANLYTFQTRFYLNVQRGRELPRIISNDMVIGKEYYWLVPDQTLIESGVTVTVTQGAQIQFWSANPNDPYSQTPTPFLQVEGNLLVLGTLREPIELFNSANYPGHAVDIPQVGSGRVEIQYARVINPRLSAPDHNERPFNLITHSYFVQELSDCVVYAREAWSACSSPSVNADEVTYSIFHQLGRTGNWLRVHGESTHNLYDSSAFYTESYMNPRLQNNVFLKNYRGEPTNVAFVYHVGGTSDNHPYDKNAILNVWWDSNPTHWLQLNYTSGRRDQIFYLNGNYWGTTSTTLIDAAIYDYQDDFNLGTVVYQPILTTPVTTTYPFVVDVLLSTAHHSHISIVGAEPVTFTVTFNRDMDLSVQPVVSFGPDVPQADYTIHPVAGGWANARTWQGTFNITSMTGDGYQLIRVAGAVAADDPWLVTGDDAGRFRFEIITSGTESMNLQGNGGEGYIDLTWTQTDFDLLAGFNLYRSTSQHGSYTRLNSTIIPPDQRSWRDPDVTPGQPYFYKFTIVKSDMSESDFSNVATATPVDTIAPVITHTPLSSASPGLPLTLFTDVTDNVAVQSVKLFFRPIGGNSYSQRTMMRTTDNRYTVTVEGASLVSPGIEYYIEAGDGVGVARTGRPDLPYQITVVDKPVVTTISPTQGPAGGGTAVTIRGTNFKTGATVMLGGAACSSVQLVSNSEIRCNTPPHFPETVDIRVSNPDGQYGSLLRGFTYMADRAAVGLPATGGGQQDIVQVPINAANVQGLAAADLTVTFDSSVLAPRTATVGNLTPGWSLSVNTTTPGQLRLSMAAAGGAVSGSGVLANLEFAVLGSAGVTTTLQLAMLSLNDGAIPADMADGLFTVSLTYGVAGQVRYWQGATGVPSVTLSLVGDRLYAGASDTQGAFQVTGVRQDSYTLTPDKRDGVNGISAYDAALVLQHAVGNNSLSGYAATAADINKSGAITALDAYYILQKAVDLIMLPFPGAGVVWTFDPPSRNYGALSANQSAQDFTALLLGDVSGNWIAGGQASGVSVPGAQLMLVEGAAQDDTITLQVHLNSRVPIYSLEFSAVFATDAFAALEPELTALTQGWLVSSNRNEPGRLRVAMAGVQPFIGNGAVLKLRFHPAQGQQQVNARLQEARADEVSIALPQAEQHIFLPLVADGR